MNKRDLIKKVFSKLKTLSKLKTQKEFDDDMVEMFYEALADYEPEQILYGIKMASKTKTYGLQPSDITEHLEDKQEDQDIEISRISQNVYSQYQHKMLEGRGELPRFEDTMTQQAFLMTVNENDWKEDAEAFAKYFKPAMKRNLKNLYCSPKYQSDLLLQEAQEKAERKALYERGGSILGRLNENSDTEQGRE